MAACEPVVSAVVVSVAVPPASVPVPIVVAPSLKVTAPVNVPVPGAVIVTDAVKVTGWPNNVVGDEVVTVAVVAPVVTV